MLPLPAGFKLESPISGKVTIIELLWVILLIGGASSGVQIGYSHFGICGAVVGLPLGIGIGLVICSVLACFLNILVSKNRKRK